MKSSKARTRPPAYLSETAQRWWRALLNEYEFETSDALMILESALQSFDRWQQARSDVDQRGLSIPDRFGQPKPNPAILIERDSKTAMLRGLKQLGLDIEPPNHTIGRPPGRF